MNTLFNHTSKSTPPPELPQVISHLKSAYSTWLVLHKNFPKIERFGIGNKIEQTFIYILELTFALTYLPPNQKIGMLNKVISRLDVLKFFIQLAWENKLIPADKYPPFITNLEEIGRQLGGWKKGLQQKTPRQ